MAGCIAIAIGLIIDVVSVLNFKSASTTINPLKPENSSNLVQRGFYSISRNPMYLGMENTGPINYRSRAGFNIASVTQRFQLTPLSFHTLHQLSLAE